MPAAATSAVPDAARDAWPGAALALAIVAAWLGAHVFAVYRWSPAAHGWPLAAVLVLVQTWLTAGLFILAHDCMHGSLLPGRPRANRVVGAMLVALYAGFRYGPLKRAHLQHHRSPGTAADPDFDDRPSHSFGRWFARFVGRHFRAGQLLAIGGALAVMVVALGASPVRLAAFWALPAVFSAVQLFAFGTWLPHRRAGSSFADAHRARSGTVPAWLSLATCFHFGRYHHEHHLHPGVPWWRLPAAPRAANDETRH